MAEPAVIVETDGHALTVTPSRPEKRDAVGCEVRCRLYDARHPLDEEDDRCVSIPTGSGTGFCAGMALTEIDELGTGVSRP